MQNTVPSRKKFAGIFKALSRVSFWLHLALGGGAAVLLVVASLSRGFSDQANSALIGLGIFLIICALLMLCFRAYWAYRHARLAKRLQLPGIEQRPRRADIIRSLQTGLAVSVGGMLIAFLATEATAIAVLAKTLAQPQGVAVYSSRTIVRSLDILLILANVNVLGAHLFGSLNALGLLHWVTD